MRAGLLGIAAAVAAAGASAAVAAAAGPPPLCTGPSVAGSFALIPGSPGAGNVVYALRLHLRRGARTCVVTGVPALRLLSRSGAPLPTRVVPARPRRGLPVRVVLRTGTWASASARFSPDVPGPGEGTIGRCEPVAHRLRVMLAGRSSLVVAVAPPTSVCSHGFLSVSTLVAGRTPPGGG